MLFLINSKKKRIIMKERISLQNKDMDLAIKNKISIK